MKQKNPKNTQNFITSKKHVKEILKYTNINKQDKIIEIGSGKEIYVVDLEPFRNLQWLLSNATNNINQIAKATNTTGVIYKNEIETMNKQIEKLSREIWQIHSLLLNKSKESSGD